MVGPYTKGPEIKIWFVVKVEPAQQTEAETRLCHLGCERQWNKDWTIRKIERIHIEESRKLDAFAPASDCEYDFFILVAARDRSTLLNQALPEISKALGLPLRAPRQQRAAHVLLCAFDLDGH